MTFSKIESLEPREYRSVTSQETDVGFNVSLTSSTIPSLLVIGGKKIHGIVDVKLEGNSGYAQKGSFAITIDAELNGIFTPIATVKRRLKVTSDADITEKVPVIPNGKIVEPGSYAIYVNVKDPAGENELSTAGPTLLVQPKTYAFSETLISTKDVSVFESDDYITGLVEAYTLQIQNTGNVATTGNMQIKLESDASTTANVTYLSPQKIVRELSVPVGQSRKITVKYRFTVAGVQGTAFIPVLAVTQNGVSDSVAEHSVLSG